MKTIKAVIISCAALFLFAQITPAQRMPGEIVLGVETSLLPAMVWVAENKGYFEKEGLHVTIKEFGSGRTALQTMLKEGNLDMVTAAQTPVVFNSFERRDFLIIAAMVHSVKDVKILARRDKGIKFPLDLKGKKVGTTIGSTGHFFLGLFLIYHGLGLSDVDMVDLEATQLPQALVSGRVDAISTWEPHILNAGKELGGKAVILPDPGIFREDFYFVASDGFVKKHPKSLRKFLKAVARGEAFIRKNRAKSIRIVSQRLNIVPEITASIWDYFDFNLTLDQSILISLEHEARWAVQEGLVNKRKIPDYLDFIHMDALEDVDPAAVTIIR